MNFTIIIPTFNRGKFLKQLFKQIVTLRYSHGEWEVIIVDNNSVDDTKQQVVNFAKQHKNLNIRYVHEPKQGRTYAFETALNFARHKHILSLDDDVIFQKTILNTYRTAFKTWPDASIIGGKIKVSLPRKVSSSLKEVFLAPPFIWILGGLDLGNRPKLLSPKEEVYCANMAIHISRVKRPVYHPQLGKGYKNVYICGDDQQLCRKMTYMSKKAYYDPKIVVSNKVENSRFTISYFIKRYVYEGVARKIIDTSLISYKQHEQYTLKTAFQVVYKSISHLKPQVFLFLLLSEVTYSLGYFFLSRFYEKNTFPYIRS